MRSTNFSFCLLTQQAILKGKQGQRADWFRETSPYGAFYCVFRWDLSRVEDSPPKLGDVQVRPARDDEIPAAAEVWHRGLKEEEGLPWAGYLKAWTPTSAAKWFMDATKRQGARIFVAEQDGKIVGMSGVVFEKRSGIARFLTGVVVASEKRRKGIGSSILHKSLLESKREGLRHAEVETIKGDNCREIFVC